MFNLPAIFSNRSLAPSRSLEKLFDPTFDLFDSFFEDFKTNFGSVTYVDAEGNGVFEVEVPGFNKDNLKVELSKGVLTIQGSRELKDKNYAGKSNILKRLEVGEAEEVEATVQDGILKLVLKYPKPAQEEKRVFEVK